MKSYDLIVVGGGCAGISAALAAEKSGISKILIVEQDDILGGILNQCIHSGFGLVMFGENLTGPEFAEKLEQLLCGSSIEVKTGMSAVELTAEYIAVTSAEGFERLYYRAAVLACGCREIPIGGLPVWGTRPSGIFSAGQAQRMINLGKMDIGDDVLILGSGDVGMIVARRLRILGKHVIAVIEKGASCGGKERNRIACLDEYNIPLITRSTITRIYGNERIIGIDVFSENTCKSAFIPCRTLITSVGLVPERSLLDNFKLSVPGGIFLCGNCQYVHDTADSAAADGCEVGNAAAQYIKTGILVQKSAPDMTKIVNESGILCTECPHGCTLIEDSTGKHGGLCNKYR